MRRSSFSEMNCSIAQSLEIIGEWWTPLIIRDALMGVTRFDQFQARLGIARNVLTQRLDGLVDNGILETRQYHDRPPRNEYLLTPKGRDLWRVMMALREWGDTWLAPDGAPVEVVHDACRHATHGEPHCSHCGEPLRVDDLTLRHGPGSRGAGILPSAARR